jgi:hypothetical protein
MQIAGRGWDYYNDGSTALINVDVYEKPDHESYLIKRNATMEFEIHGGSKIDKKEGSWF